MDSESQMLSDSMEKAVKIRVPCTDDRPLWDVFFGVRVYPAVFVAHELKLFELLSEKPLGLDEIAAAKGIARQPAEALLAVREYNPEVVLLDIGLPGMDGYEVARCLRSEMGDDVPLLVAMTGYSQHEVSRHARKAEFDHHLVKPADMGALRELLTQTK